MSMPQKIVLKSTTKISLNDRFTQIAKTAAQRPPVQQTTSVTQQHVYATMAAQQQATARNRRLALQMANRPAVQAALKLKKKSMQQRLGSNVRSRLSLRGDRGGMRGAFRGIPRGAQRGGIMVRGAQRGVVRGTRGRGQQMRGLRRNSFNGSQASLVSASSMSSRLTGVSDGSVQRGNRGFRRPTRMMARGRGRGGFYQTRGAAITLRGRGGRGMRGRGMQRGRGGRGGASVSKEALDDDMDEYMSKTRGALDSELDLYMHSTQ